MAAEAASSVEICGGVEQRGEQEEAQTQRIFGKAYSAPYRTSARDEDVALLILYNLS